MSDSGATMSVGPGEGREPCPPVAKAAERSCDVAATSAEELEATKCSSVAEAAERSERKCDVAVAPAEELEATALRSSRRTRRRAPSAPPLAPPPPPPPWSSPNALSRYRARVTADSTVADDDVLMKVHTRTSSPAGGQRDAADEATAALGAEVAAADETTAALGAEVAAADETTAALGAEVAAADETTVALGAEVAAADETTAALDAEVAVADEAAAALDAEVAVADEAAAALDAEVAVVDEAGRARRGGRSRPTEDDANHHYRLSEAHLVAKPTTAAKRGRLNAAGARSPGEKAAVSPLRRERLHRGGRTGASDPAARALPAACATAPGAERLHRHRHSCW